MLLTLLSPTQSSALDSAHGKGLINGPEVKAEDGKQRGVFRTVPSSGRWLLTQPCQAGSTLRPGSEVYLSLQLCDGPFRLLRHEQCGGSRAEQGRRVLGPRGWHPGGVQEVDRGWAHTLHEHAHICPEGPMSGRRPSAWLPGYVSCWCHPDLQPLSPASTTMACMSSLPLNHCRGPRQCQSKKRTGAPLSFFFLAQVTADAGRIPSFRGRMGWDGPGRHPGQRNPGLRPVLPKQGRFLAGIPRGRWL